MCFIHCVHTGNRHAQPHRAAKLGAPLRAPCPPEAIGLGVPGLTPVMHHATQRSIRAPRARYLPVIRPRSMLRTARAQGRCIGPGRHDAKGSEARNAVEKEDWKLVTGLAHVEMRGQVQRRVDTQSATCDEHAKKWLSTIHVEICTKTVGLYMTQLYKPDLP